MQIAIAQLNYIVGDLDGNCVKILKAIENAKQQGVDLILFSELALCGYPPRDILMYPEFIDRCEKHIQSIATACQGIAVLLGAPMPNPQVPGKPLFNSAYFMADGVVKKVIHKTLLPTYDVFDEHRYFEENSVFEIVEFKGQRLAVTICEDLWNLDQQNPLYRHCPMEELMKLHPDMMLNIAASPFDFKHADDRKRVLQANAKAYNLPIYYCNQVGAQTELIFDGGSLVMNAQGELMEELPYFEECVRVVSHETKGLCQDTPPEAALVHDALVLGVRDYFQKMGFKKAILGLSGGVDSALVMVIAQRALGAENVHALLLPSAYSSDHSLSDARDLANNLGCSYDEVPIQSTFDSFQTTLAPFFKELPFGLAEENLQARTRGVLLMAFSNKFGYILLNTTNKSEAAVGYGTLYGDMCGGIAVLGDVYKTQVYDVCAWINRDEEVIPKNILTKAPSAELRPGQKDSDSLPDYAVLDAVLEAYIEGEKGPEALMAMGFEKPLVERVLRMVNNNEWKRFQAAPILRVTGKAFGYGRRMPVVGRIF
jgi:NAD+ synthase (glutamine-hydrolysing)